MTAVGRSLQSILWQGLDLLVKLRFLWIGLLVAGLGIVLGLAMQAPEQGWLAASIVVALALLASILHRPLDGVLLWIFFTPFVETWIKIPMGSGIPDLSFSRFAIAFLALVMLGRAATGKLHIARIGLTEMAIVVTTLGIMAAAPLSVSPPPMGVIQTAISSYFTPLCIYFFAKNLVKSRKELHQVLIAIAILGFVSGTYAIYEYATGNVLFLPRDTSPADLILFREALGIRIIRGIWGGTGSMGRALAIAIPVTFYLFLESKGPPVQRLFLGAMLVAQSGGILVAMSRTPWYSLLIALFVMQFAYPRFRRLFLAILCVSAVLLVVFWDQVAVSDVAARVTDRVSTLEGRQTRWEAGLRMWLARPVRGWGFGRYEEVSGRYRSDGLRANLSAIENDYLYVLVGSGLIGFVPYLLVLAVPLLASLRLFLRARLGGRSGFITQEMIAVYWAVMLSYLIGSFTARDTQPGLRLMVFAVAGAVVGTHEYLLRRDKGRERSDTSAVLPAAARGTGICAAKRGSPAGSPQGGKP